MILPSGGVPAFCAPRRRRTRAGDVPGLPPLPRRLLRALSGSPDEPHPRLGPRRRGLRGRDPPLRRGDRGPSASSRSARPRCRSTIPAWEPIWATAAGARPHGGHPLVHHDGAVPARHVGHLGQRVPPARRRPRVERAAQHGGPHRRAACSIAIPQLRLTSLECGHGWLAFWAVAPRRAGRDVAATPCRPLKQKPSEYIRGPQYFQSIQLHEGELSLRQAIEALGDDTLMFATDYPALGELVPEVGGRRPGLDLDLRDAARRKLLWDNAARCYRRYGSRTLARS